MELFRDWLAPGGVAVVTTAGRGVLARHEKGLGGTNLPEDVAEAVVSDYRRSGYGYADYPGRSGIGFSLSSIEWACGQVEALDGVRMLMSGEGLWGNHQDVIAIVKKPIENFAHCYVGLPERPLVEF